MNRDKVNAIDFFHTLIQMIEDDNIDLSNYNVRVNNGVRFFDDFRNNSKTFFHSGKQNILISLEIMNNEVRLETNKKISEKGSDLIETYE